MDPGTAGERTFAEDWRRMWRRVPDMGDAPIDPHWAFAQVVIVLVGGSLFGVVLVLWIPSSPPTLILSLTLTLVGFTHIEGVRHRWWALGAGLAAGVPTGLGLTALLPGILGARWATLIALLAASVIGIIAHAAVTHVPRGQRFRLRPGRRV